MKLNRDNYELVMFDLLEGNLAEADELRVMKQIEEDEFLFKEWKFFKATVLVADKEVVYKGKDSLLKAETVALPMYTRWMAIAASVAILGVAFIFWPEPIHDPQIADLPKAEVDKSSEQANRATLADDAIVILDAEDNTKQRLPNPSRNSSSSHNQKEETASVEIDVQEQAPVLNGKQEGQFLAVQEKIEAIRETRKTIDGQQLKNHYSDQEDKKQTEVIANNVDVPKEEIIEEKLPPKEVYPSDNKSIKRKVLAFVTNNPIERITSKTVAILANAKSPKLKVTPDFKSSRPSLNVEFSSEGYQAIASLQPFKNKDNLK